MRNTNLLRSGAVLFALLITADATQAISVRHFPGSRDQVRASCKGEGRELIEGGDYSACMSHNSGVVCGDDGKCIGTGPRTVGAWGIRTRDYQPPMSSMDSGGRSSEGVAAPKSSPPATPPVIN